jgi:hypothetical protein
LGRGGAGVEAAAGTLGLAGAERHCPAARSPCLPSHAPLPPPPRPPPSLCQSVVAQVLVTRNAELAAAERRLESARAASEAARAEAAAALDAVEARRRADAAKDAAEREKLRRRELQLEVGPGGGRESAFNWPQGLSALASDLAKAGPASNA